MAKSVSGTINYDDYVTLKGGSMEAVGTAPIGSFEGLSRTVMSPNPFYSPPPPDPYKEVIARLKPRITRITTFVQSGNIWYNLNDGLPDFQGWQKTHPSVLITGTSVVWHPNQLQMQLFVTYSEEL